MTTETLVNQLEQMRQETAKGGLKWNLEILTSEYKPQGEKTVVEADGKQWMVDEIYVDYHCVYHKEEFAMITYENVETSGEEVRSTNMVYLPPLGVRCFSMEQLAPYSVQTTSALIQAIHQLWTTILAARKQNPDQIVINANE
ncbi:MAG: hypothetical protein ACI4DO_06365 [Roseburia sp.]